MLTDCRSKDHARCELAMVHVSAGDQVKLRRDREFQAVLPVDRTILDIKKANLEDALDNDPVKQIVAAVGTGFSFGPGLDLNLSYLRYGKIILGFDSTPEGTYIRTQVVSLFYQFLFPILQSGQVYGVLPTTLPDTSKMQGDEIADAILNPLTRHIGKLEAGTSLDDTLQAMQVALTGPQIA